MAGEINFGILNQNLPAEIAGSYYRGQEQQQQNALAKQQLSQAQMSTQVSGMQLEKMKRDAAALDQMQKAIAGNGGPPDLKSAAQAMINSGMPDHINHGLTLLQKLQDLEDNKRIMGMGGPAAAPAAGGMSEPYAGYNAAIGAPAGPAANEPYTGYNAAIGAPTENALAPMAAQPPAANALAPTNTAKAQQIALLRQQKNAFLAKGNVASANSLEKDIELLSKEPVLHVVNGALVGANGVPVYQAPPASDKAPDAELMARLGYPLTREGYAAFKNDQRQDRLRTPDEEAQQIRIARASQPPAQPRAEPAPSITQIVNPANRNEMISIDTRVYRGGGIGSPGVIGLSGGIPASQGDGIKPLTEQQLIKLRTEVAKDYNATSTTLSQMEDLLASIEAVKTAPGLSAATGYTGVYLPSFSEGKAATAETRVANLRGKITALGKATAAMTGSIGAIANQEWKILADQVAVIDLVKGKKPLLEQIELVEAQAKGLIAKVRDAYEKTRAEDFKRFPQFKDLPAPGAPAPVAVPSPGAPTRENAARAGAAPASIKFLGFEPGTQ